MGVFGKEVVVLSRWQAVMQECGCCPPPDCCPPLVECEGVLIEGSTSVYLPCDHEAAGSDAPEAELDIPTLYHDRISRQNHRESSGSRVHEYRFRRRNATTLVVVEDNQSTETVTYTESFAIAGTPDIRQPDIDPGSLFYESDVREGIWWPANDFPPGCLPDGSPVLYYHGDYDYARVFTGDWAGSNPDESKGWEGKYWLELDSADECGTREEVIENTATPFFDVGEEGSPTVTTSETLTATEDITVTTTEYSEVESSDTGWVENFGGGGGEVRTETTTTTAHVEEMTDSIVLSSPFDRGDARDALRERLVEVMANLDAVCDSGSGSAGFELDDGTVLSPPLCVDGCGAEVSVGWPTQDAEGVGGEVTISGTGRAFRYRIKLDKCCLNEKIRLEWDEVFYPQSYLDWLEGGASGDPPDEPVVTPKAWEWEGIPPGCGSSSAAESDHDSYDEQSMWSPWSLAVIPPLGGEGVVLLKNMLMDCNPDSPWGSKPMLVDTFGEFDSEDLDEDPDTEI